MSRQPDSLLASPTAGLLQEILPAPAQIGQARARLHRKAVAIGALVVASYGVLVLAPVAFPVRVVAAAALVVGLFATATGIMHDANHGAFSRSARINRLAACTADLLGASSSIWRFTHNNLHHGNTNVIGADPDIDQAPFGRLTPADPWRRWHRYQHVYLWFLYGFLALRWFLFADFVELAHDRRHPRSGRPRRRQLAGVVAGKAAHLGWAVLLPLALHPWWGVLAFYVACSWLVGFALAVVFQLAHCNDRVSFAGPGGAGRGEDFAAHQLATTADIGCDAPVAGAAFAWLVGGLHHQVEHHLAPRLPHTANPAMGLRLRRSCLERGITYHRHPGVLAALASHARWLRAMGRSPTRPVAVTAS